MRLGWLDRTMPRLPAARLAGGLPGRARAGPVLMLSLLALALVATTGAAQTIGGFGADTPGGSGRPVYRVTSLADSGPGTLREALAAGDRMVQFDVAGDIVLQSRLFVGGDFVTIDGFSAPPPRITLRGYGLILRNVHHVIVRGIRVRDTAASRTDGISVQGGSRSILIHHVSVNGAGDGNIDIGGDPANPAIVVRDVTVAWSILATPAGTEKNMLIKYNPARISLHHNLFVGARQRNPQVRIDDAGTGATETTVDLRNNVVWDWAEGYGTLVWYGPWANIVGNYYASPLSSAAARAKAVRVSHGARAFMADNLSADGVDLDSTGTEGAPFPPPAVATQDACTAAWLVLDEAGARPLDTVDASEVAFVSLAGCEGATRAPSPPPHSPPSGVVDLVVRSLSVTSVAAPEGTTLTITERVKNRGDVSAGPLWVRLYLSTSASSAAGALLLGSRPVPGLAPGQEHVGTTVAGVPSGLGRGRYYIVAMVDADDQVAESDETNNRRTKRVEIE